METFFVEAAPAIQATRPEEGVARTTGVEEEAAIKGASLTGTSPTRRTAGKSSSRTTRKTNSYSRDRITSSYLCAARQKIFTRPYELSHNIQPDPNGRNKHDSKSLYQSLSHSREATTVHTELESGDPRYLGTEVHRGLYNRSGKSASSSTEPHRSSPFCRKKRLTSQRR